MTFVYVLIKTAEKHEPHANYVKKLTFDHLKDLNKIQSRSEIYM